jgi:hypothetical protein
MLIVMWQLCSNVRIKFFGLSPGAGPSAVSISLTSTIFITDIMVKVHLAIV